MARIHITDLPLLQDLSEEQLKELFGAGPKSFRPGVEVLEDRLLMSASAFLDPSTHLLKITDTGRGDHIQVLENNTTGKNSGPQLKVLLNGSVMKDTSGAKAIYAPKNVAGIDAYFMGSGEQFDYQLTRGDFVNAKDFNVMLGPGNNTAQFLFAPVGNPCATIRAQLGIYVHGGDGTTNDLALRDDSPTANGNDTVKADFGTVASTSVTYQVQLGAGVNTTTANVGGDLFNSRMLLTFAGAGGTQTRTVTNNPDWTVNGARTMYINPYSHLSVQMSGSLDDGFLPSWGTVQDTVNIKCAIDSFVYVDDAGGNGLARGVFRGAPLWVQTNAISSEVIHVTATPTSLDEGDMVTVQLFGGQGHNSITCDLWDQSHGGVYMHGRVNFENPIMGTTTADVSNNVDTYYCVQVFHIYHP